MYFMSTASGRPQGEEGVQTREDACGYGGGGGKKHDFVMDLING